jgi:hypothetical protein
MICHKKNKIAEVLKMTINLGNKLVTGHCKELDLIIGRGLGVGVSPGSATAFSTQATFSAAWLEWCLKGEFFPVDLHSLSQFILSKVTQSYVALILISQRQS